MSKSPSGGKYTKEETATRLEKALRSALTTPPKPHSEMKVRKVKTEKKKPGKPAGRF